MIDIPSLKELRKLKPSLKRVRFEGRTVGERLADKVAEVMGSWYFIVIQAVLLVFWIAVNVVGSTGIRIHLFYSASCSLSKPHSLHPF